MRSRIVWLYRSILGESRFVFNSRKEMINYAGKLCMRSLTFEHSDSGKHIWKAGRRIVFFFLLLLLFFRWSQRVWTGSTGNWVCFMALESNSRWLYETMFLSPTWWVGGKTLKILQAISIVKKEDYHSATAKN